MVSGSAGGLINPFTARKIFRLSRLPPKAGKQKKEKIMNIMKKYGKQIAVMGAAPLAFATQVWAEVPQTVKDDIATAKTDAVTVAGLILGVSVAIFGVMILMRFFR